ncbi:multicopper oxidase family protein [Billgrantia kenyensis]|uniref:Multicopper oxidase family protein n=1 Tax=Billgrantia kenyensis TaxID=321266 RepID=A0A7V9W1Z0_9GAMM|nr:multicopper oxidase family protein [Halomonas kenyensis]MBA2779564.1 multicopper oxidase family protein [Halomonas kenyensis]MCG6662276.1 multicopper oxidase family protein [Halomonas kenyensis]
MKRREFLGYSALGALLISTAGTMAYALSRQHPHGASPASLAALPPGGQPLQPLPRIVNLSDSVARFRSALTPGPHSISLSEELEARLWLYNGKVAPLIEVREGDELDVTLINELEQETTLHWHGVPVPQAHDGAPWDAVAPGETRQYRYTFPPGSAGLHWFHPHPHEGTAWQVAHGLAGALLVRPTVDVLPDEIEEHLLVVSDLRLRANGEVAPHTAEDWMNGREGELLLVNGQHEPHLDVAPGTTLRLRLINACAGRYLRLRLDEHELTLIGTDGGLIERPQPLEELLLTPGERADLLVRISEQAEERFLLASHPYERGWMGDKPPHLEQVAPLLAIQTLNAGVKPAVALPERLGRVEPLGEPAVRRQVELTEVMPGHDDHGGGHGDPHAGHDDPHAAHGGGSSGSHHGTHGPGAGVDHAMDEPAAPPEVDFLINGRAFAMDEILFEGKVGEVEEWEVFNNSHMDHPFHVHGTHFQVIATRDAEGEWQQAPWLAWKDTVNLAPYQRLKLRMVFREPGDWLFHCHIIEHEELGMMATIRVS